MAEKPILCAAPVVRAILDGRQTQDRRPVKNPDGWLLANPSAGRIGCYQKAPPHLYAERDLEHPFTPGDVLYVRETWAPHPAETQDPPESTVYRADLGWWGCGEYSQNNTRNLGKLHESYSEPRWRPSIHMPKWAARIRLRVLSVGVERVNAISEEDAAAEGCGGYAPTRGGVEALEEATSPRAEFAALWDSLYGAGSFARGDWCWVTRFERVAL